VVKATMDGLLRLKTYQQINKLRQIPALEKVEVAQ
jgi:ribosomal protein S5